MGINSYFSKFFSFFRKPEQKNIETLVPLALTPVLMQRNLPLVIKDISLSYFKSLHVLMFRPFNKGDMIKFNGHEGIVNKLAFSYMSLIKNNKNEVFIPTSNFYNGVIEVCKKN